MNFSLFNLTKAIPPHLKRSKSSAGFTSGSINNFRIKPPQPFIRLLHRQTLDSTQINRSSQKSRQNSSRISEFNVSKAIGHEVEKVWQNREKTGNIKDLIKNTEISLQLLNLIGKYFLLFKTW